MIRCKQCEHPMSITEITIDPHGDGYSQIDYTCTRCDETFMDFDCEGGFEKIRITYNTMIDKFE